MNPVIIVALVLLLVAIGVLFFPWSARNAVDRNTLNRRFYRSRLGELEQEGHGPDDALVVELQRTLLNDIPGATVVAPLKARQYSRLALLPGALILVVVSLGVYLKTSSPGALLAWQQAREHYPQLMQQVRDPGAAPLRDDQLAELALGLRSHLEDTPANPAGWRMLGRIGITLNDNEMALGAFERAWQLAPKETQVAVDYAGALVRSGEQGKIRQGELLLRDVLNSDPRNAQALDLLAFSEYLQQRYTQAADYWQQALALTPADDPQAGVIAGNLRLARQHSQQ